MLSVMVITIVLCIIFAVLYRANGFGWMLSCAITFGTVSYHIIIRFLSPVILTALFRKKYDYRSPWFRQRKWEKKFYDLLQVGRWKTKAFTYDPSEFSPKIHSFEEIANNMCHAEAVHELIVLLSFTSLFFAVPFGSFAVFLITAVLAAVFDMSFVIIQRYNRPKAVKIIERKREHRK